MLYGVIRKKLNSCICSGCFPAYVHFEFSVSACYYQLEKGYGIVFFVCRVEFYVIVSFVYICVLFMVCKLIFVVLCMTTMSSTYRT